MTSPQPDDGVLPCGCFLRFELVDGVRTMFISRCRDGCQAFEEALRLAREQGKPITEREA